MVVELKDSFFKIIFHWTIVLDLNIFSFHVFLYVLSFSS